MKQRPVVWLIVLCLVLTRLSGLHLHACACVEEGVERAGIHYADNGLLFGEHHESDDEHDVEMDVGVSLAAKLKGPLDESLALPSVPVVIADTQAQAAPHSARGPPSLRLLRPHGFAPPPRGPPVSLA